MEHYLMAVAVVLATFLWAALSFLGYYIVGFLRAWLKYKATMCKILEKDLQKITSNNSER